MGADVIALVLATYYVAITVAKLHGPLGLCERFRERVWRWRGFELKMGVWLRGTDDIHEDWIAAGVQCPLCCSVYVGAALLLLSSMGGIGQGVVDILAVAGGASVLFSVGRYW